MTSAGCRDARGHCVHSVTAELTNLGEVSDARRVVCSAPPGPARVTTIGEQKAANPLLAAPDEDAFARRLLASLGLLAYFARLGEVNRRGPALLPGQPGLAPLTPAAVSSLMDQDGWVIDVRPVAGFAAGHIPGPVRHLAGLAGPGRGAARVRARPGQDPAEVAWQALKVASMTLGNLAAFFQTSVKRLLAYPPSARSATCS